VWPVRGPSIPTRRGFFIDSPFGSLDYLPGSRSLESSAEKGSKSFSFNNCNLWKMWPVECISVNVLRNQKIRGAKINLRRTNMTLNRRFAIALGITALLGAAVVSAEQLGKADVPFAFEAAGQKWAAGTYTAARQNAAGTVLIRNSESSQAMFIMPVPVGPSRNDTSSMAFNCYGSQCFLSKIQFGQTRTVYQVHPSQREKELAHAERPQVNLVAMR